MNDRVTKPLLPSWPVKADDHYADLKGAGLGIAYAVAWPVILAWNLVNWLVKRV